MNHSGLLAGLCLLFAVETVAATIPVGGGLVVEIPEVTERWSLYREPPDFLLAETAEHLGHEAAAQGNAPTAGQLREAAARRLSANEAFLCNRLSRACLVIDFSPLRQGEKAPGHREILRSAGYAAEGLAEEEGVTELRQSSGPATIQGARHTARIEASYRQHGKPLYFLGYVGFADPAWFYLYYTDPLHDAGDRPDMERLLRLLSITSEAGR